MLSEFEISPFVTLMTYYSVEFFSNFIFFHWPRQVLNLSFSTRYVLHYIYILQSRANIHVMASFLFTLSILDRFLSPSMISFQNKLTNSIFCLSSMNQWHINFFVMCVRKLCGSLSFWYPVSSLKRMIWVNLRVHKLNSGV